MKHLKYYFSGVVLLTIAAIPTFAVEVQYNTVGTFMCNGLAGCTVSNSASGSTVTVTDGTNTSTLTYSDASDDFTPASGDTLQTNFSAGIFTPGATKLGKSLNGITLDIKLNQTIPSPTMSGDFIASISGSTSTGSNGKINSTATARFAPNNTPPPSITLDGVIYTLDNDAYKIAANPLTSIQGSLDATALPEPAFFALTGIGFFGMFGIAWSRYKQRA